MNFEEIKENAISKKNAIIVGCGTVAASAGLPMVAFAEGEPTVDSVLTTGVGTAVTNAQSAIMAVLPQALTLMGVVLGITIGIRVFTTIAKRK